MRSTGSRHVAAHAAAVRSVLLRPTTLPEWNPAFLALGGASTAVVGDEHPLTVLGGLRGVFTYTAVQPARVEMEWQVPGLAEWCAWQLEDTPEGTRVVHEVERRGALAVVFGGGTAALPGLRLQRLADVVNRRGAGAGPEIEIPT